MKPVTKLLASAFLLGVAMPASAGTVTACIAQSEGRDGVISFNDYAVAQSPDGDMDTSLLRAEAEQALRDRNRNPGRVICQTGNGAGHYVIVAGGLELNGRVRHLIGFGFGDTRAEALQHSSDRLNNVQEYHAFTRSGGEMTVIEEGAIGS